MSEVASEKGQAGRPRKRATEAKTDERYAEVHRLEQLRDEAAKQAEVEKTVAAKADLCAAEQRVCAAWAAAFRGEMKITESERFAKLAVQWAAAHSKALDQLIADRVEDLHRRFVRREAAAKAAEGEETQTG